MARIYQRTRRLARFFELYPEATLELIALGEPVSVEFLREAVKKSAPMVDKVFNLDFQVEYSYNPNAAYSPLESSDVADIYSFMQSYYHQQQAEVVLDREVLWNNFLKCATGTLFRKGLIQQKLVSLLKSKDYDKALHFVIACNPRYYVKIQRSIPLDLLSEFFEAMVKTNYVDVKQFFDVQYLANNNVLTGNVVKAYISSYPDMKKGVKNLLRKNGGLEVLKELNDIKVNAILLELKAI